MKFFAYLSSISAQIRQVRALARPYFNSEEKWKARGWLGIIIALNMGSVFMLILFNEWNRVFFDALQTRDGEVFWRQMGIFVILAIIYMAISVYKFFFTQLLALRWRSWMTNDFLSRWLGHHTYYKLELARYTELGQTPQQLPFGNPDQRLQEDIGAFTEDTLSLTMGLVHSIATLLSFIGILWVLNDTVSFTVGSHTFEISGFMVWMAVAYAVAGSLLTHKVTYRLTGLNFAQKKFEADFRHHLIRVRESSESIALDQGEAVEFQSLQSRFASVLKNAMNILKVQRSYTWFTSGYGQAAVVFPFVVAAPRFFSGAIQLGELMQISTAFSRVQDSLSWIVDNYIRLSVWRAATDRLTGFVERMQACEYEKDTLIGTADTDKLEIHNFNLALPSGTVLLTHPDLEVEAGDSVLITGASGSGKSTLFRAFAGIWPFAQGEISRPAGAMFIPQRAYFPIGKLRDALTYPEPASTYTDEQLQAALTEALLPYLVDQLDTQDTWGQMLSGGEQQRLAIARVLLKQPRWIFADEATNALDEPVERALYQKLLDNVRRKGGAMVSISHRPDVRFFYNKHWQFEAEPAGTSMRFHLTLHGGWSEGPDGKAPDSLFQS